MHLSWRAGQLSVGVGVGLCRCGLRAISFYGSIFHFRSRLSNHEPLLSKQSLSWFLYL